MSEEPDRRHKSGIVLAAQLKLVKPTFPAGRLLIAPAAETASRGRATPSGYYIYAAGRINDGVRRIDSARREGARLSDLECAYDNGITTGKELAGLKNRGISQSAEPG